MNALIAAKYWYGSLSELLGVAERKSDVWDFWVEKSPDIFPQLLSQWQLAGRPEIKWQELQESQSISDS